MNKSRQFLLAALLLSFSTSIKALDADVTGLQGEAADNVIAYLAEFNAAGYSQQRLRAEILRRAREALRAFGYYQPNFTIKLQGDPIDEANIHIDPGPQVTISELDIQLMGNAEHDDAFQSVIDNSSLEVGDPLHHGLYDSLHNRLSTLALERGYFDANFTQRRMEVRPWEHSARIYLAMNSGDRYHFGEVSFSGSQVREQRLRNMLPFTSGDPYLADSLGEYGQRLGETGWFRGVSVRPYISGASAPPIQAHRNWWEATEHGSEESDSTMLSVDAVNAAIRLTDRHERFRVPINVELTPADRHQFEVGLGFATDVGPRSQFTWEQPWLNEKGDSLRHQVYLSAPEQEFIGEYRMPLDNPLRDRYELLYGLKNLNNKDTRSFETTGELARRWEFENEWIQRLYFRTTYEDYRQADQENQVLLLYPGISWTRTRTRQPNFPSWGDYQHLSIEVSDDTWGSDASFVRTTLDTRWIRMIGDKTRIIARTSIGAMSTDDFSMIPPSLRFFAGGDRSVRGYDYESLAPKNEDGELLGGQHQFTSSLEWQQHISGKWWGAAFVDTGNAFNEWWPDDLATGAGLGVRWISPVGPLRVDIAHPFDDEEDAWRLHFAIGPEF